MHTQISFHDLYCIWNRGTVQVVCSSHQPLTRQNAALFVRIIRCQQGFLEASDCGVVFLLWTLRRLGLVLRQRQCFGKTSFLLLQLFEGLKQHGLLFRHAFVLNIEAVEGFGYRRRPASIPRGGDRDACIVIGRRHAQQERVVSFSTLVFGGWGMFGRRQNRSHTVPRGRTKPVVNETSTTVMDGASEMNRRFDSMTFT